MVLPAALREASATSAVQQADTVVKRPGWSTTSLVAHSGLAEIPLYLLDHPHANPDNPRTLGFRYLVTHSQYASDVEQASLSEAHSLQR
jgi:hypothetical protein